jgi:hypothetical protein
MNGREARGSIVSIVIGFSMKRLAYPRLKFFCFNVAVTPRLLVRYRLNNWYCIVLILSYVSKVSPLHRSLCHFIP